MIVTWHPQYRVCPYQGKGVFLLSETQSLWLPAKTFPGFCLVDSYLSCEQIMAELKEKKEQYLFQYQLQQLLNSGQLIKVADAVYHCFINKASTSIEKLYTESGLSVYSLSAANKNCKKKWLDLVDTTLESDDDPGLDAKPNVDSKVIFAESGKCQPSKIIYIMVDDYLDKRLADLLVGMENVCLLKISGDIVWISPIFSSGHSPGQLDLDGLQKRLKRNQPVRQFVERLFPQQTNSIPFSVNQHLSREVCMSIKNILQENVGKHQQYVSRIDIHKADITRHSIKCWIANEDISLEEKSINRGRKKTQLNDSMVVLQSCPALTCVDGGSRNVSPQVTLNRLSHLVDPITGLIANISLLQATRDLPIKIYRSTCFKTPNLQRGASLDSEHFVQVSMGKGMSDEQSRASALCEAIERQSALYLGVEKNCVGKQTAFKKRSYDYQDICPYSARQYETYSALTKAGSHERLCAKRYEDQEIPWSTFWSLSHREEVFVPFTLAYANTPFEAEIYGRWQSNGCAAGNTPEEAIIQALYELIERDASALWWYNKISHPAFKLECLPEEQLQKIDESLSPKYNYWALDLSSDIRVPVVAAIAQDKKNGSYVFGFGCHLRREIAAQRALTELCQLIPIRNQHSAPFDFDAIEEGAYLHPNKSRTLQPHTLNSSDDIKEDILNIVDYLKKKKFETLVLDYRRKDSPVNTVKVIVPGLCHIWPQLANERLYETPLGMQWLEKANHEGSINSQALLI